MGRDTGARTQGWGVTNDGPALAREAPRVAGVRSPAGHGSDPQSSEVGIPELRAPDSRAPSSGFQSSEQEN